MNWLAKMRVDENFKKAMPFLFRWEGGHDNDPKDRGGETKWGISQRAYPKLNIAALTKGQARGLYYRDYWLKAGCDKQPWPFCLVVFDCAVNQGVGRAKKFIKKAVDWRDFLFLRIDHYVRLAQNDPDQRRFFRGWINRVRALYNKVKADIAKEASGRIY